MPWTNKEFVYALDFEVLLHMNEDLKQNIAPSPEEQEKVKYEAAWVDLLRQEIGRVIVGQKYLVDRLIIGLLANGHVLLEGVPGLAKRWP